MHSGHTVAGALAGAGGFTHISLSKRLDSMDTGTSTKGEGVSIEEQIALIKGRMPETYKAIQAKAGEIGKAAFGLVRRGLKGEANCFYAFERGHVVGTPFSHGPVPAEVAQYMVQFGGAFVCIWSMPTTDAVKEAINGTP